MCLSGKFVSILAVSFTVLSLIVFFKEKLTVWPLIYILHTTFLINM